MVIQHINNFTMRNTEQFRTMIIIAVCKPDLKMALSMAGSQLKMMENLISNQ